MFRGENWILGSAIFCFAAIAGLLFLAACSDPAPYDPSYQPTPSSAGRVGMTYGGKLGVELAPGIVLGYDGKIQPGFGF